MSRQHPTVGEFLKAYKPWPDLTRILGVYMCGLLSELHACWEFGCVIPRNGQRFACCLLVENFLLGPWSKSVRTRETLKVTCVTLSPELAELPTESLPCSAAIPGQFAPLPSLFTNWWDALQPSEHATLQSHCGCGFQQVYLKVWTCKWLSSCHWHTSSLTTRYEFSWLMAGRISSGSDLKSINVWVCQAWALCAETAVQELVWLLYIWKAAYKKNLCCSFLFMYGISHVAGGEHGSPNYLQVSGPCAGRNLTEDLLMQSNSCTG